jgi:hypothetical protein
MAPALPPLILGLVDHYDLLGTTSFYATLSTSGSNAAITRPSDANPRTLTGDRLRGAIFPVPRQRHDATPRGTPSVPSGLPGIPNRVSLLRLWLPYQKAGINSETIRARERPTSAARGS